VRRVALFALCTALPLAACSRAVGPAFGPTPSDAARAVRGVFDGFADRFVDVRRDARFARARGRIARSVLAPSLVFDDTATWPELPARDRRAITYHGYRADGRYWFATNPTTPAPRMPGEARHHIAVRRVGPRQFDWLATVDFGLGTLRAAHVDPLFAALLRGAERPTSAVRVGIADAFPRGARVAAQLFALDTLVTRPVGDAWEVRLVARVDRTRLAAAGYPALARYVQDYVEPTRFRAVVRDIAGHRWLECTLRDGRLALRWRSRDGRFVPFEGAGHAWPDTTRVTLDFSTEISFFRVGYRGMVADLYNVRAAGERGWELAYRRVPAEWDFPLATDRLLTTPLRRPFSGDGTRMRLVVADSGRSVSVFARRVEIPVEESAITRFLARLGGTAFSDFAGPAESEESRWNAALWTAIRDDLLAQLP
jgi:hypothetical protein